MKHTTRSWRKQSCPPDTPRRSTGEWDAQGGDSTEAPKINFVSGSTTEFREGNADMSLRECPEFSRQTRGEKGILRGGNSIYTDTNQNHAEYNNLIMSAWKGRVCICVCERDGDREKQKQNKL